jgi:hypothetical protein
MGLLARHWVPPTIKKSPYKKKWPASAGHFYYLFLEILLYAEFRRDGQIYLCMVGSQLLKTKYGNSSGHSPP